MKHRHLTLLFLAACISLIVPYFLLETGTVVTSQSRDRRVNTNGAPANENDAGRMPAVPGAVSADVVKVDVDLVTVDALVLQKDTARIVGGLKKEDFLIYEDGAKQEITHFSQDALPLSVLFLIDRGGCLDPFGDQVHRATREAIERLKPTDEV